MDDLPTVLKHLVFDYLGIGPIADIEYQSYADLLFHDYSKNCFSIGSKYEIENFKLLNKKRLKLLGVSSVLQQIFQSCANKLTNLTTLDLYGCMIAEIPSCLGNLTELTCVRCSELTNIASTFKKLKFLECTYCPQLQKISGELINLVQLKCTYCESLQSIPKELINLEQLACYRCPRIREIPKELINLTKLNCSECFQIQDIPKELIKLRKLDCCGCGRIKFIPKELHNLKHIRSDILCHFIKY